ncbi:MAG: CoB--CoM heterodisulfide reductase iron-sulfur subunit A family protein [Desulfovermiculus sp.]|nr:CoB--CoM heterodisulfide reductase iron-sulfur subunit A family protein [Desulfovermiculus sp.]
MSKTTDHNDLRIGVFVCDCGSNIAGHLNCREVTKYASSLPGVAYAKENLYTCSESGIQEIKKGIVEHNLNRVVVASCSPRTHQPLFSSSCAEAGLNPYLFEMVNIRDQCSWVHMGNQEGATEKAKELVRMGVAKSANLEPQQDIISSLVPRALVIGAGIAGMSAALSMAEMGLEVVLLDKASKLGGVVRALNRIGPAGVLAQERIDPLIQAITQHPNITLYTGAQVKHVGGYIGNYIVTFDDNQQQTLQEEVGCIVVATGALPLTPEGKYGYNGQDVITQMELESRLKQGEVNAQRVVMIQCVGARDAEREYCSRICCLTAVKNALLLKEHNPDVQVHILYRDMQMYGTTREQLLWEARGEGIDFSVYDPAQPPQVDNGQVRFYHSLLGKEVDYDYDLIVLSTPLVARQDATQISRMMRVPTDQNGFFLEAHAKLRPLDFAADGIFVCGSARYPACVDEARSQGIGVASRVGTVLFKDQLVASAIVAEINPQTCVGCLGCLDVCPYQAISYDPEQKVCRVNDILCKGCGNCAATCPSESAQLRGFKPSQLLSQIRAAA